MHHLINCPHCGKPGHIAPGAVTGTYVGECSEQIDCKHWPVTSAKPTEAEAAAAWNTGEVETAGQLADAELT